MAEAAAIAAPESAEAGAVAPVDLSGAAPPVDFLASGDSFKRHYTYAFLEFLRIISNDARDGQQGVLFFFGAELATAVGAFMRPFSDAYDPQPAAADADAGPSAYSPLSSMIGQTSGQQWRDDCNPVGQLLPPGNLLCTVLKEHPSSAVTVRMAPVLASALVVAVVVYVQVLLWKETQVSHDDIHA